MAASKKKDMPVREFLENHTLEEGAALVQEEAKLHVVEEPKPKPEPGSPDFDWQAEYPGEEVFVYTVPASARRSPGGKQSPPG